MKASMLSLDMRSSTLEHIRASRLASQKACKLADMKQSRLREIDMRQSRLREMKASHFDEDEEGIKHSRLCNEMKKSNCDDMKLSTDILATDLQAMDLKSSRFEGKRGVFSDPQEYRKLLKTIGTEFLDRSIDQRKYADDEEVERQCSPVRDGYSPAKLNFNNSLNKSPPTNNSLNSFRKAIGIRERNRYVDFDEDAKDPENRLSEIFNQAMKNNYNFLRDNRSKIKRKNDKSRDLTSNLTDDNLKRAIDKILNKSIADL